MNFFYKLTSIIGPATSNAGILLLETHHPYICFASNNRIVLHNLRTGERTISRHPHFNTITSVTFAKNLDLVVSCDFSGTAVASKFPSLEAKASASLGSGIVSVKA